MKLGVRRSLQPMAAYIACLVASLAVVSCASSLGSPRAGGPSTPAGSALSGAPNFVGYVWRLAHVTAGNLSFDVQSRDPADPPRIQFTADEKYGASDGVNYMSGTFTLTNSGFAAQSGASTLVGYAGTDRDVLAIIEGIGALVGPGPVTVTAAGSNAITMSVRTYQLTFRRAGFADIDTTTPSSTGSTPPVVYGTPSNCDQSTAPANMPCPGDSVGSS